MSSSNLKFKLVPLALVMLSTLGLASACNTQADSAVPSTSPTAQDDFIAAVQKIAPSVVAITADIVDILGQPGTSAGTGWVLDANGIIVTNNHVIEGGTGITITLNDGRRFGAQGVATNPERDLAVIKIGVQNLVPATIGDSSGLAMGQAIAAVGNALDLGISMTGGYVSRLNTSAAVSNSLTLDGLIQTDALVNHGDSGGPLITRDGEVVGIVTAGLSGGPQNVEGVNYAISINTAMPVINRLISQLP